MDQENEFLIGLLELQYGQDVKDKLQELSAGIGWAKGWPEKDISFWNAEAFMWGRKIEKGVRLMIAQELLCLKGRNLDLGCGSYSYIPSVGFDFSSKMLDFNENLIEKVEGDLEKNLPFDNCSFDSVTAVFVMNYVQNFEGLIVEVKRVITSGGIFKVVLGRVHEWQRQKEVNSFSKDDWLRALEKSFMVSVIEKGGLMFFICKKPKNLLNSKNS